MSRPRSRRRCVRLVESEISSAGVNFSSVFNLRLLRPALHWNVLGAARMQPGEQASIAMQPGKRLGTRSGKTKRRGKVSVSRFVQVNFELIKCINICADIISLLAINSSIGFAGKLASCKHWRRRSAWPGWKCQSTQRSA